MSHSLPVLEREDIALFINAASACTGQSEYYGDSREQRLSLSFLHEYVFGNYRRLYALCLVAGINDYNQALIIARLLRAGTEPVHAPLENALIRQTLGNLPPQRVYRLFRDLRRSRVNNRRTRATLRAWLATRDLSFDAVKYRGLLRSALRHAHLRVDPEIHAFLFEGPHSRPRWDLPLFDSFRRAKYEQRAIYELPFTIAEGLASAHGIPRKRFLAAIEGRMTAAERRRHLERPTADGESRRQDLSRMPLTAACRALLGRAFTDRNEDWRDGIRLAAKRTPLGVLPRRVRAVLDNSLSSRGSQRKPYHPLAVALSVDLALRAHCEDYQGIWTHPPEDAFCVRPMGSTRLGEALLDALEDRPDLVVLVSDGYENDPSGAASEIVRLFRQHVDPQQATAIIHLNPVFDATSFMPRVLGASVPTVGLRDVGDLEVKLAFARFTLGSLPLSSLETWLEDRC